MFIEEELAFVKSQIQHHKKSVQFMSDRGDTHKIKRHAGILRRFEELLPKMEAANLEIEELKKSPKTNQIPSTSKEIGSRLGNIMELPDELRSQLVSIQVDQTEQDIVELLNDGFNGIASIDEILVGLYHKTGEVLQRDALANKIYRMSRKELLYSVAGKKGVYSTSELETEKAADSADTPADKLQNENGDLR